MMHAAKQAVATLENANHQEPWRACCCVLLRVKRTKAKVRQLIQAGGFFRFPAWPDGPAGG